MVRHDMFEVAVCSGNEEPLPEYIDPQEQIAVQQLQAKKKINSPVVIRYVEAVSGTNFGVKISVDPGFKFDNFDALGARLHIDGKRMMNMILLEGKFANGGCSVQISATRFKDQNQESQIQRFRFGSLNVLEDAAEYQEKELKRFARVGEIQLAIWRLCVKGRWNQESRPKELLGNNIPEAAIKGRAADLQTHLDPPQPLVTPNEVFTAELVDRQPLLTFMFKYQSRESLYREGILELPSDKDELVDTLRSNISGITSQLDPLVEGSVPHSVKEEPVDNSRASRKRSVSEVTRTPKRQCGSTDGYLQGLFHRVHHEVESIVTEEPVTAKGAAKKKAALLSKVELIQDEVQGDASGGDGSLAVFFTETFKKIRHDIEELTSSSTTAPKDSVKRKAALLRKLDALKIEVFEDDVVSDSEKTYSGGAKQVVQAPPESLDRGREVFEISDED